MFLAVRAATPRSGMRSGWSSWVELAGWLGFGADAPVREVARVDEVFGSDETDGLGRDCPGCDWAAGDWAGWLGAG